MFSHVASNVVFNPFLTLSVTDYCKNVASQAFTAAFFMGAFKLIQKIEEMKAKEQAAAEGKVWQKPAQELTTTQEKVLKAAKIGGQVLIAGAFSFMTGLAVTFALGKAIDTVQQGKDLFSGNPSSPNALLLNDNIQSLEDLLKIMDPKKDKKEIEKQKKELNKLKEKQKLKGLDSYRTNMFENAFIQKIQSTVSSPISFVGYSLAVLGSMVSAAKDNLAKSKESVYVKTFQNLHCDFPSSYTATLLKDVKTHIIDQIVEINFKEAIALWLLSQKASQLGGSALSAMRFVWLKATFADRNLQAICLTQIVSKWNAFTDKLHVYCAVGAMYDVVPDFVTVTIGNCASRALSSMGLEWQSQDKRELGKLILYTPFMLKSAYNMLMIGLNKNRRQHIAALGIDAGIISAAKIANYVPGIISSGVDVLPSLISTPIAWAAGTVSSVVRFFASPIISQIKYAGEGLNFVASLVEDGLDCATISHVWKGSM